MDILKGLMKYVQHPQEDSLRERSYAAYSFFVNSLKFRMSNVNTPQGEICIDRNVRLKVVDEKSYFAFRYFTDFDNEMVEEMKGFLSLTHSSKCFLDVGAHYGIFSLAFSVRPDSFAYALEPSPDAFEVLEGNIALNADNAIKAYPFAAGSSNAKINLFSDGSDHFVATQTSESYISVDMVRLDDFILEQEIKPDVIKIDVEGYELDVLSGAQQLLVNYSPLIFLEIHPVELQSLGKDSTQLVHFIKNLNYEFFDPRGKAIDPKTLIEIDRVIRVVCRKPTQSTS